MPNACKTELMHMDYIGPKEIAGLDYNWSWIPPETAKVIHLYNDGLHYEDIAEDVNRYSIEVLVWLNDLIINKRIEERLGGIYGKGKRKRS